MGVKAIGEVLDLPGSLVSGSDRLVLIVLADYANSEDGMAWPSVSRLAAKAGLSVRTAQRSLRQLVGDGFIEAVDDIPTATAQRMAGLRNDRTPVCYRLTVSRGVNLSPREDSARGDNQRANGVTTSASRGDNQRANGVTLLSPEEELEPSENQLLEPETPLSAKTADTKRPRDLVFDAGEGSRKEPPRRSRNDPRRRPDPLPDPPDPTPLPTFVGETKPARPRDPVFDAIAEATGIDLTELSKADGKRIGMVAADLRERWQGDPDGLPTEVDTRTRRLRTKWGDKTVTPTALAKHWSALGAPKPADRYAGSEAERIMSL